MNQSLLIVKDISCPVMFPLFLLIPWATHIPKNSLLCSFHLPKSEILHFFLTSSKIKANFFKKTPRSQLKWKNKYHCNFSSPLSKSRICFYRLWNIFIYISQLVFTRYIYLNNLKPESMYSLYHLTWYRLVQQQIHELLQLLSDSTFMIF